MITGSYDKTIRLYDIRKPRTLSTLTYHKKSVRALAQHPRQYAFASGGADNIKKFGLPEGEFLHNMLQVGGKHCLLKACGAMLAPCLWAAAVSLRISCRSSAPLSTPSP